MKKILHFVLLALIGSLTVNALAQDTLPVYYSVEFKGQPVATQTVLIAKTEGRILLTTSFEAELPVFTALQPYSEKLSVTFRPDGTVERFYSIRHDGPPTEVRGELQEDGLLHVIRSDVHGITTNSIDRSDYDFNSLALYGTDPVDFLPTNHIARVLSVADGAVQNIAIQTISESDTFERQHLVSQHLIWTEGLHTSHSWHPERFSHLPRRYVRQTENGEFTFTLQR